MSLNNTQCLNYYPLGFLLLAILFQLLHCKKGNYVRYQKPGVQQQVNVFECVCVSVFVCLPMRVHIQSTRDITRAQAFVCVCSFVCAYVCRGAEQCACLTSMSQSQSWLSSQNHPEPHGKRSRRTGMDWRQQGGRGLGQLQSLTLFLSFFLFTKFSPTQTVLWSVTSLSD